MTPSNALVAEDPTACPICGRDACDGHEPPSRLITLTLDELRQHRFPARPALLVRDGEVILRAGHLGEVVAARGVGKTWLLQTIALVAASHTSALGFHASSPCRVLYLDGEMAAEELQVRFIRLADLLHVPPGVGVTTLAADWQDAYLPRLDTQAGKTSWSRSLTPPI